MKTSGPWCFEALSPVAAVVVRHEPLTVQRGNSLEATGALWRVRRARWGARRYLGQWELIGVHFRDLELCAYHSGALDAARWAVPLQAVGWLETPHAFPVGPAPAGLLVRLRELVEQTRQQFAHYQFRGIHECSVCGPNAPRPGPPSWSQENLLIPGNGVVYAAPGGVVHYIEVHAYLPPPAFITAVLGCHDVGSDAHLRALRAANAGLPPPIETANEFADRIQGWQRARR